eukprot:TRINITY_DN10879_c0_g1_i1.p1 TRINITY_DN10879_c0_g1~~TRINITY_DN10879_c0_g1_i1.p1  ORF type:complete len:369 (+),score=61.15 TRINITY_DN10879_c0_g1_i1:20-1126(+)
MAVSLLLWLPIVAATVGYPDIATLDEQEAIIDENGYLMYCPCMGRFGNQAAHLLGSLALAKEANRTLVVPPFIYYEGAGIRLEPYDFNFDVPALSEYHRVITMEDFMNTIAFEIWPEDQRYMYCYNFKPGQEIDCHTKQGNPFGPFWDEFGVDFVGDREVPYGIAPSEWQAHMPPSKHFVVAMRGAPASFPVRPEHRALAQYVEFSADATREANDYIDGALKRPVLAAHLRVGSDWRSACDFEPTRAYMASPQCEGIGPTSQVTKEMCLPAYEAILNELTQLATKHGVKSVYLGTDDPSVVEQLKEDWPLDSVMLFLDKDSTPMQDQAIFAHSDFFIGNCVSSFTAFAARYRQARNKHVAYWTLSQYA